LKPPGDATSNVHPKMVGQLPKFDMLQIELPTIDLAKMDMLPKNWRCVSVEGEGMYVCVWVWVLACLRACVWVCTCVVVCVCGCGCGCGCGRVCVCVRVFVDV